MSKINFSGVMIGHGMSGLVQRGAQDHNRHGADLVGVFALGVLIGISGTGVLIKNRLCISLCIMLCRAVDWESVRCFNAGVPGS